MSSSTAETAARRVIETSILRLDYEIEWRTEDLLSLKSRAIEVDGDLEKLKRERTALKDALAVHFPVAAR